MFEEKNKIGIGFRKVEENFLIDKKGNTIYQETITRTGVAVKTISLLLCVSLFAWLSYSSFIPSLVSKKPSLIRPILFFSVLLTFGTYLVGVFSVSLSKACSWIFAMSKGFTLGALLLFLRSEYIWLSNFNSVISLALISTILVFAIMLLLYSNNILVSTFSFQKKMLFCTFIILSFSILSIIFAVLRIPLFEQMQSVWFIALPINMFLIVYSSLTLILYFDYVEQMIFNNMTKKYEWQLSLCFVAVIVLFFIRILKFLLNIFRFSRKDMI
ncbi:Bax inhibitor-1/YccA family membrane protein ['Camptotheca acuminata' phytoplasma]|uniref:Bax inhibitor-1/YccA family membrane protein n=1 Tax='Camptotheca acuminata' phytoplasma TaxID=3239192 RepID=UPI003519F079